jgi:hypothetical protein
MSVWQNFIFLVREGILLNFFTPVICLLIFGGYYDNEFQCILLFIWVGTPATLEGKRENQVQEWLISLREKLYKAGIHLVLNKPGQFIHLECPQVLATTNLY